LDMFSNKIISVVLFSLSLSFSSVSGDIPPNPIIPASSMLEEVNSTRHGKLFKIESSNLHVLHLYGTPQEMGVASGYLLAEIAEKFLGQAMPEFYKSLADQIPLDGLPKWLQKLLQAALGDLAGPAVKAALKFVYSREQSHITASKSKYLDEIEGFAQGMCSSGTIAGCNVADWVESIKNVNMLPELIRMSCSMLGAWGQAVPEGGGLVQLRALDFGDGPFANYTLLTVYHPDAGGGVPFASVGFPGMVGVVTGFSKNIGLSEKVWETYNNPAIQPGHYDGEPVTFVMRDMLQWSDTKEDAVKLAMNQTRTWAVFLGVGDFSSQEFVIMGYREKDLQTWGPQNISSITHFAPRDDLVYIDKHPQPSHDNITFPMLVEKFYGNFTGKTIAQNLPRSMETGDLHITVYDYSMRKVWLSVGVINADGAYGDDDKSGKACFQRFLEFNMDELWAEPEPSAL